MYVFAMTTDHASTETATVDLPQGTVAYRAAGPATSNHPPVVLVHGLLVDARLWAGVADRLAADGVRSYAPTLPLGSHQRPMKPDADLSPQGVAELALDFIKTLDLTDVIIAGNDTGGAICQVMLGADTSRISAAVFTNCDALGTFPSLPLAPLFQALRHPGLVSVLAATLRPKAMRHGPLAYGPLARNLDPATTLDWIQPLANPEIRRDLAKFARAVDPRVLLDAARRFAAFPGPVRILWGEADSMFRLKLGRELAGAFPQASLSTVPGGRTFLPLDHPDRVAAEVATALREVERADSLSPDVAVRDAVADVAVLCGRECGIASSNSRGMGAWGGQDLVHRVGLPWRPRHRRQMRLAWWV
jgi:pimeloyl-ACP methyl ester carboxylesterase